MFEASYGKKPCLNIFGDLFRPPHRVTVETKRVAYIKCLEDDLVFSKGHRQNTTLRTKLMLINIG